MASGLPPSAGPQGCSYLCMKHITDRHAWHYSYAPTGSSRSTWPPSTSHLRAAPGAGLDALLSVPLAWVRAEPPGLPAFPPLVPHGSIASPTILAETDQALGGARCSLWSTASLSAFCDPSGLVLESLLTLELRVARCGPNTYTFGLQFSGKNNNNKNILLLHSNSRLAGNKIL